MKLYIVHSSELGKFVMISEAAAGEIEGFEATPKIRIAVDVGMPISSDFATSLIGHVVNQVTAHYGAAATTAVIEIDIP